MYLGIFQNYGDMENVELVRVSQQLYMLMQVPRLLFDSNCASVKYQYKNIFIIY